MHTFEVRHFRLVAGFNQRFKSCFDERTYPAAQNNLFAKEVSFGLFRECRFDDTAPTREEILLWDRLHRKGQSETRHRSTNERYFNPWGNTAPSREVILLPDRLEEGSEQNRYKSTNESCFNPWGNSAPSREEISLPDRLEEGVSQDQNTTQMHELEVRHRGALQGTEHLWEVRRGDVPIAKPLRGEG